MGGIAAMLTSLFLLSGCIVECGLQASPRIPVYSMIDFKVGGVNIDIDM